MKFFNNKSNKWFRHTPNDPVWEPLTWQGWLIFIAYWLSLPILVFFSFPLGDILFPYLPGRFKFFLFLLLFFLVTFIYFYVAEKKSR